MLLNFVIKNFMSFREEACFSMMAAQSVKEYEKAETGMVNTITLPDGLKLLKTAAIYGPNGCGKSNLIHAVRLFREVVVNQDKRVLADIWNRRFLFDESSKEVSVSMEIEIVIGGTFFRYGFEIFDSKICSEWLFRKESGARRESAVFKRIDGQVKVNRTLRGLGRIGDKLDDKSVCLSLCALSKVEDAVRLKDWLENSLIIASGRNFSVDDTVHICLRDPTLKENVEKLMSQADKDIRHINIQLCGKSVDDFLVKSCEYSVNFERNHGSKDVGCQSLSLESDGIKNLFCLSGPWVQCLRNGGTLLIDDFGVGIHPSVVVEMMKQYQLSTNNTGQLIAVTQNLDLMNRKLLRRDQIWFVDKSVNGESSLYSLVEFKSVRNDSSYAKDYLNGRYGAMPSLR